MYVDELSDAVNKYTNANNSTIKMKPVDVNPSMYIEFGIENNHKNPKFKVGNHVRIPNIKTFLEMITLQIGLKMLLMILIVRNLLEHFTIKNCKK